MDLAQALAIQQQLCTLETELYKHESFIKAQQVAVLNLKMLLNQQVGYNNNSCSRDVVSVQPVLGANGSQLHQSINDDLLHLAINKSHSSQNRTSAVNVDYGIKKIDCTVGSAGSSDEGTSNRLKRARPMTIAIPDGDRLNPNRAISTKKRRAISKAFEFCCTIPRFAYQWATKHKPTADGRASTATDERQIDIGRGIHPTSEQSNNANSQSAATSSDLAHLPGTTTSARRKRNVRDNERTHSSSSERDNVQTTKQIFSSGRFSNASIVAHCKSIAADDGQRKWEILSDLDFCQTGSMKGRLQELLGRDVGVRDLLMLWLNQAVVEVSRCSDSRMTNSIVEHTLQLLHCSEWTPADASLFKVDKVLKSLYKSYSAHEGAHQQSVAAALKGMWPRYRLMRKQFEKDGTYEA